MVDKPITFAEAAQSLDDRKLSEQRFELLKILRANLGLIKGMSNDPAAIKWRGHEFELVCYGMAMCDEWVERGYTDSLKGQYIELVKTYNIKPKSRKEES